MESYLTERILRSRDGTLPHMGVKGDGDVAPYVLLSGNPARVERMKERLTQAQRMGSERGYVVYTGVYKGTPVTVASSGMGCPSMEMSLIELAAAGGSTFIRTGSCASIKADAGVGTLIIAIAAVRDEGTSPYYAPAIYPAVADHNVVTALCQAAESCNESYNLGIIRTTDSFYEGERKAEIIDKWRERSVIAFEMESAALFTIASVMGNRSGTILVPGANLITGRSTYLGQDVERYRDGVNKMITVSLEAIAVLAASDRG